MRAMIFAVAGAMALTACGGATETETDNTMVTADNMMMDPAMNTMAPMDGNMMMDGNMAADPNMQNMMIEDATTNNPDTNLANGM